MTGSTISKLSIVPPALHKLYILKYLYSRLQNRLHVLKFRSLESALPGSSSRYYKVLEFAECVYSGRSGETNGMVKQEKSAGRRQS
jgi:hypothetical protein